MTPGKGPLAATVSCFICWARLKNRIPNDFRRRKRVKPLLTLLLSHITLSTVHTEKLGVKRHGGDVLLANLSMQHYRFLVAVGRVDTVLIFHSSVLCSAKCSICSTI